MARFLAALWWGALVALTSLAATSAVNALVALATALIIAVAIMEVLEKYESPSYDDGFGCVVTGMVALCASILVVSLWLLGEVFPPAALVAGMAAGLAMLQINPARKSRKR